MPKLPTDYSRTVIYKIVCLDKAIEYSYVGSTTDFTKRKFGHKSVCNNQNSKHYNIKLYSTIRENGNWENWTMVQIEEYPCNNKREAECREEYWRVELNSQLNMNRPYVAETKEDYQKQYQKEHKEELKEYKKEYKKKYREANKIEIKEQSKIYQEANKIEIKERKKKWYEVNKVEINKRRRELYQLNKQLLQENKSNV